MTKMRLIVITVVATILPALAESQTRSTTSVAAFIQAQTYLIEATEKAPISLTDALTLVRLAEREASDDVIKKTLNNLDPQTNDALKAVRTQISSLILDLEGRFSRFQSDFRTAGEFVEKHRPQAALNHLATLRDDAPSRDPKLPFDSLRVTARADRARFESLAAEAQAAENMNAYKRAIELLETAGEIDRDEIPKLKVQIERLRIAHATAHPKDFSIVWSGALASGVLALVGVAIDASIEEKVKAMSELQPGEASQWLTLYDEAQRLERPRDISYQVAAGVAGLSAMVGLVKAIRSSANIGGRFRGQSVRRFSWHMSTNPNRPMAQIGLKF